MKELFPGYYIKSETDIKQIWEHGIIMFDTNVLLNLYRYSDSTQNTILELIKRFSNQIYLPHQAALEYNRNRYEVIAEQEKAYNEFLEKISHIQKDLQSTSKPPFLTTKVDKELINEAIKEKLLTREHYPFSEYKIKSVSTKKRAISKVNMDLIENVCCLNPNEEQARTLFLLLFYFRGMNFWDLTLLKIENMRENRIDYTRAKTHKQYSVNVNVKAKEILKPFIEGKTKDEYIFPFVTRDDPEMIRKDIDNARHTFNKYLKKVGTELKIGSTLTTSYVSRHSYATIGKKLGVSMAAISESLGHSNLKTTQIYLDSFENDYLDDINNLITG